MKLKKSLYLSIIPFILTGCTYSVSLIHTSGTAADVGDEQQTPTATISADLPMTSLL